MSKVKVNLLFTLAKLNRKFIGIEKDQNFFLIAQTKLEKFINNKIDLTESNSKL